MRLLTRSCFLPRSWRNRRGDDVVHEGHDQLELQDVVQPADGELGVVEDEVGNAHQSRRVGIVAPEPRDQSDVEVLQPPGGPDDIGGYGGDLAGLGRAGRGVDVMLDPHLLSRVRSPRSPWPRRAFLPLLSSSLTMLRKKWTCAGVLTKIPMSLSLPPLSRIRPSGHMLCPELKPSEPMMSV